LVGGNPQIKNGGDEVRSIQAKNSQRIEYKVKKILQIFMCAAFCIAMLSSLVDLTALHQKHSARPLHQGGALGDDDSGYGELR
jgi:hypothetical protein